MDLRQNTHLFRQLKMMGYNQGDAYEQKIFSILKEKNLILPGSSRAGAGNAADIQFIYQQKLCNLEVKLDLKADYGQKMLKWQDGNWFWSKNDVITDFYTSIGVLAILDKKQIVPNRFVVPKEEITLSQKKEDQKEFEDRIPINIKALYNFYAEKDCYYIQVGGYGFYHLKKDILSLGTPQFKCDMNLRLRAKTIHSKPIYNYGFYAVLKPLLKSKPKLSFYNLEDSEQAQFPPLN